MLDVQFVLSSTQEQFSVVLTAAYLCPSLQRGWISVIADPSVRALLSGGLQCVGLRCSLTTPQQSFINSISMGCANHCPRTITPTRNVGT